MRDTLISQDRYEMFGGVKLFFYDRASIQAGFGLAGLLEIGEVTENYPFFLITCKKTGKQLTFCDNWHKVLFCTNPMRYHSTREGASFEDTAATSKNVWYFVHQKINCL
ncbi:hypothetical protein [Paraflavitalea speifideaquila]|uniref:hypothetical protein n=1 Tax=Paraflavitalea speifideaquila TaxID=3076558 RepID=UPI0028E1BE18|nr:hypothetical protein [Paraflavitalea speifideiaquila]